VTGEAPSFIHLILRNVGGVYRREAGNVKLFLIQYGGAAFE